MARDDSNKGGLPEGRHGWEHQETRGGAVLAEVEGRIGSPWSRDRESPYAKARTWACRAAASAD